MIWHPASPKFKAINFPILIIAFSIIYVSFYSAFYYSKDKETIGFAAILLTLIIIRSIGLSANALASIENIIAPIPNIALTNIVLKTLINASNFIDSLKSKITIYS